MTTTMRAKVGLVLSDVFKTIKINHKNLGANCNLASERNLRLAENLKNGGVKCIAGKWKGKQFFYLALVLV